MRSPSVPGGHGTPCRDVALLGLALWLVGTAAAAPSNAAQLAVLDRFAGAWDVTATTRLPKPAVVKWSFVSTWTLDHHFLRGESGIKSDGSQELQVFGHEAGGYSLWIFYSSGLSVTFPRGEWNEATATMTWKNAPADTILYTSRCTFEGAATMRCSTQVKDLSGKLKIDVESVALRRKP
jgi:hypothetical protein